MSRKPKPPEGHVVVATIPEAEETGVSSVLYAVVADTVEQAVTAVQEAAPDSEVTPTSGTLSPETVERLDLEPNHPKQIG